jgi:hypothetical protein
MNQKKVIALLSILILNSSCLQASKECFVQSTMSQWQTSIKRSSQILQKKDPFGFTLTYTIKFEQGALEIIQESNGCYNARCIHFDEEKNDIYFDKDQAEKLYGIAHGRISTLAKQAMMLHHRRFNEAA